MKVAAETLVTLANERGGHDNITVVNMSTPKLEETLQKKRNILDWILGTD